MSFNNLNVSFSFYKRGDKRNKSKTIQNKKRHSSYRRKIKRKSPSLVSEKMEPPVRVELTTYWLQISCSTSWAKVARAKILHQIYGYLQWWKYTTSTFNIAISIRIFCQVLLMVLFCRITNLIYLYLSCNFWETTLF